MNKWYIGSVRYTKEFRDGTLKRVNDKFVLNATSFTDAEARLIDEFCQTLRGGYEITKLNQRHYEDLLIYDDSETWWEVRIAFVSEDADTGKEKRFVYRYLVNAVIITEAIERVVESLKGFMVGYEILSAVNSGIVDVFIGEGYQHKAELEAKSGEA